MPARADTGFDRVFYCQGAKIKVEIETLKELELALCCQEIG